MIRINGMRVTVMVGVLIVALHASPVRADVGTAEAGVGTAAAISSLVYGPVKIVYAVLGVVFGGFAWGLSGGDTDVMTAVVSPSVRGDYVVTPGHIRGEERLEFIGRQPEYREDRVVLEEVY